MILTEKAKEDFIKYYKFGKFHFENVLDEKYQYAEIIEWLDSVGIYILITDFDGDDFWCEFNGLSYSILGKTRQEATEKAIIKANEIYNERDII